MALNLPYNSQPHNAFTDQARPYWRGLLHIKLSKDEFTHVADSPWRLVVTWTLTVLFGLHGVFASLVSTFVGMALGVTLEAESRITSRLLAVGFTGCITSFVIGLWLVSSGSWDDLPDRILLRRTAWHTRLFVCALDTTVVLLLLQWVEKVPTRRAAWKRSTVAYRRFAHLSFSLHIIQEIMTPLLWLLLTGLLRILQSQIPAVFLGDVWASLKFKQGKCDLAACEGVTACLHAHAVLCLYLVLASLAVYSLLLARWKRTDFTGSFEASSARFLGKRAGEKQAQVAGDMASRSNKWPQVFAQIATSAWLPALTWSLLSSLMLSPYSVVYNASTEAALADNKVAEEELAGWFILFTFVLCVVSLMLEYKPAANWCNILLQWLYFGVLFAWIACVAWLIWFALVIFLWIRPFIFSKW